MEQKQERRRLPILSEEDIEEIAEKASDKALAKMEKKMYETVGKTFVSKLFQMIGVVTMGLALFLYNKGYMKL